MSACMCDFPRTCDGDGRLSCRGCGGDLCVCAACYGQGESECYGCPACREADGCDGFDDDGFDDAEDAWT